MEISCWIDYSWREEKLSIILSSIPSAPLSPSMSMRFLRTTRISPRDCPSIKRRSSMQSVMVSSSGTTLLIQQTHQLSSLRQSATNFTSRHQPPLQQRLPEDRKSKFVHWVCPIHRLHCHQHHSHSHHGEERTHHPRPHLANHQGTLLSMQIYISNQISLKRYP